MVMRAYTKNTGSGNMKKGEKYKCIKTVVMSDGSIAYIKGKDYICEEDGCLTDEKGGTYHYWGEPTWNGETHFVLEGSPMLQPDIQQLLELIDSRIRKATGMGVHLQYEPCGAGGVYVNTSGNPLFLFSDRADFITEANNWLL